jgi:folate-binding protein YgfZ
MRKIALLADRAVLAVSGEDRVGFLQGLVSNDVSLAAPGRAVWAALLTPQGKWLADFFVLSDGERLLLDVAADQAAMVAARLGRFRLRSRVAIEAASLGVYAGWDGDAPVDGVGAPDPRLAEAGFRLLASGGIEVNADAADYDRHRLLLGLPDGGRDLESEKSLLLEAGFDELNGVSWTKGCYMGQELTARTRYRGLLKRRIVPVTAEGALPPPGTALMAGEREVGTMRSSRDGLGMAVVRLESLHEALTGGGVTLHPRVPAWMRLPEAAS